MNAVERVKDTCKKRNITLHKLEADCGFANGYISGLRKGTIPGDRLHKIADYLSVPLSFFVTGEGHEVNIYNGNTAEIINELNRNEDLLRLLPKYFELSDTKKKHVLELIELLS